MAYFTLASGSLRYELSVKEFRIRFGLVNKKIIYARINSVEKVWLTLILRLFGASLPGFHWGLYKTNIGNAHVYGTRISGDFIVITLENGEKIAISPEEPDHFLNAINERKIQFGRTETKRIESGTLTFIKDVEGFLTEHKG